MGREVRMVPPNWEHPKMERYGEMRPQPMYDENFDDVFAAWLENFDRARRGELSDLDKECYPRGLADWLQDEGRPPDPAYYRPWKNEDATWVQVWQTVSEGSPVTPPFATPEELINYLVENGDFLDQSRVAEGHQKTAGWNRENAEAFVKSGWAPSLMVVRTGDSVTQFEPRDTPDSYT